MPLSNNDIHQPATRHPLPHAEWFVRLVDDPAAARLPGETPIRSAFHPLDARSGDRVLATVRVRSADRPALIEREGRLVSGLETQRVLDHPVLRRYLDRVVERRVASEHLTVGVVGYGPFGGMGYTHGLACRETEGLSFAAAVDTNDERRKAAESDFPGIATYADVEDMIEDGLVDVAIVATPPIHHAPLATRLLQAGIHTVVEKPMCLTTEDADRLLSLSEQTGRVMTVHQSRRWDRDFLALEAQIRSGALGEVFNIETFVGGFAHPCRAWHSEESVSGGAIYDWGSHHVDWILQLYGSLPATVRCTGHKRVWHDVSNLDQLSLHMVWGDGREATFRQSDIAAIRRPKFYVQGTEGTIEGHYRPMVDERLEPGRGFVDEVSHHAEAPVALSLARFDGGPVLTIPPVPDPGWGFHRNLADHLLLGEPLAVHPGSARDVVRVLEAGHRSSHDGGALIDLG